MAQLVLGHFCAEQTSLVQVSMNTQKRTPTSSANFVSRRMTLRIYVYMYVYMCNLCAFIIYYYYV